MKSTIQSDSSIQTTSNLLDECLCGHPRKDHNGLEHRGGCCMCEGGHRSSCRRFKHVLNPPFYAERFGDRDKGEPYIAERGVFYSLAEFAFYRAKGWVGLSSVNAMADAYNQKQGAQP